MVLCMTNGSGKNNTVALIGYYQDGKAGKRLEQNLEKLGIPSLWCNSRVIGFPKINNSDLSTDGFTEYLESKGHTVFNKGVTKVGESTNFLLQKAGELGYKYTITLGCDEYLEGDFQLFQDNLEKIPMDKPTKLRMPLVEHNVGGTNGGGNITERVVYMPEFVYIGDVHWIYYHNYYREPEIMAYENCPIVLGLTVHHDDKIREDSRNKMMDEFQVSQRKKEKEAVIQMVKNYQI